MGNLVYIFRLFDEILSSCDNDNPQIDVPPIEDSLLSDHDGKFPGWNNDQSEHPERIPRYSIEHWEDIEKALTLASHCIGQEVLSPEDNREPKLLHLGWMLYLDQSEFLFEEIGDL